MVDLRVEDEIGVTGTCRGECFRECGIAGAREILFDKGILTNSTICWKGAADEYMYLAKVKPWEQIVGDGDGSSITGDLEGSGIGSLATVIPSSTNQEMPFDSIGAARSSDVPAPTLAVVWGKCI